MIQKIEKLLDDAKKLPTDPGCYLFKDHQGVVLYIGKAKNLKNRVQSYFRAFQNHTPKTQSLIVRVELIEFLITSNEVESFVLENNLIKKYLPKYNIRLKDDKSYPYIQMDYQSDYPLVVYTRKPKLKKSTKVFGPFPDGYSLKQLLLNLIKGLQLRDCSQVVFLRRQYPCLLYQMEQCSAPCVGYETVSDYKEKINLVAKFFHSPANDQKLIEYLFEQMSNAASLEKFERASILRDCWSEVQKFQQFHESQKVELTNKNLQCDIIYFDERGAHLTLAIYMIRHGVLIGGKSLHSEIVDGQEAAELRNDLLIKYYSGLKFDIPSLLIADDESINQELIRDWWISHYHQKIQIKKSGKNFDTLLSMVKKYAEEKAKSKESIIDKQTKAMQELMSLLKLNRLPSFLECYDVAVWQGDSPTASKIVAQSGELRADQYRYYHLKSLPEGNNDFAMLKEVLTRRLTESILPDVFVVDGGMPQWRVFHKVLIEMNLQVPLLGIAKPNRQKSKEERLVLGPNQEVPASDYRHLWWLLSHMRDEAHRFSRKLHHKKERDRFFN